MRSRLSRTIAAALALGGAGAAVPGPAGAAPTAFRNAIAPAISDRIGAGTEITDTSSPDPWMQVYRGAYYMTYSRNTSIEIRRSTEIGGLPGARAVRVWPPRGEVQPRERESKFWAPEFHRLRGPDGVRWYLYTATGPRSDPDHQAMQVLESTGSSPLGPYRFKARLDLGRWAIDATVASVRGRLYLFYSGRPVSDEVPQQMFIAPLSNPWTVGGPSLKISEATYDWERALNPINEGPEVLIRGGTLNVVYSASWCIVDNYKLGRLTVPVGADLLDPATWARAKAPEPVLQSSAAAGVFGPGHNGFFTSPDRRESWIVYHATSRPGVGCFTGGLRTARAQRFTFDRDGTPRFPAPVSLRRDLRAPSGDPTLARQAEDARVLALRGGRLERPASPRFVGDRALALIGERPRAQVTLGVDVPVRGTFRVVARLGRGSRGAGLRLGAGAGLASRAATAPIAGRDRDVDLGRLVVRRPGRQRLRVAIRGVAPKLVLDQLRFVRARG